MDSIKLSLLLILSLIASILMARTLGQSLTFRGLDPSKVRIFQVITFLVSFLSLILLGLFG